MELTKHNRIPLIRVGCKNCDTPNQKWNIYITNDKEYIILCSLCKKELKVKPNICLEGL
jgi:NAD-dependent SIR2 family protein deacetylase